MTGNSGENAAVFRIIDANLNRLREALRVVEEYYRFPVADAPLAADLKGMRHALVAIERRLGRERLLQSRDTGRDPFSSENRPEELDRRDLLDVVCASLKRAQEAARVIEEYTKVAAEPACSEQAKKVRFGLYAFEKRLADAQKKEED
jgi:thiamine-phosphate pyrophosphorylase